MSHLFSLSVSAAILLSVMAAKMARADLLYPDLIAQISNVGQQTSNGQPILKFSTGAVNIGTGPIEVHGIASQPGTRTVYQWIKNSDGSHIETETGTYAFIDGRIRFNDAADYFLREVTVGNGVGSIVSANDKVAYCFVDSAKYTGQTVPNSPGSPVYGGTGPGSYSACGDVLGTSVGWVDDYPYYFSTQYVPLTGVSSGTYWLENIIDPLNRLVESNESNNLTRVKVTISTSYAPEIDLIGNGQSIATGDATPASADHTDFGYVDVANGSAIRTFTIQNSGNGTLSLTGVPRVQIVGNSDFTVAIQPASPIAVSNGTTTFQIAFDPSGMNSSAMVMITNNDANEGTYQFAIRGNANTGNADSDGDGMPDEWESLYSVSSAAADDDGDGMTNLSEFIAGTSPVNPGSRLQIKEAARSGDGCELKWESVKGRTYKLYSKADPSPGTGQLVNQWSGTGDVISTTISPLGDGPRFYRLTAEF